MRIADVIRGKGDLVVTVRPDDTVRHLLTLLARHQIGALVVSTDQRAIDGIVSERDVVRRLNEVGAAVLDLPVRELMTTEVTTCGPDEGVEHLMRLMTDRRVRHIPVVVDGALHAIISIGDIVKHRIDELQTERDELVGYINR